MVIFAISLSIGLGLQLNHLHCNTCQALRKILMTSGLLPAAALAIILNLILPENLD